MAIIKSSSSRLDIDARKEHEKSGAGPLFFGIFFGGGCFLQQLNRHGSGFAPAYAQGRHAALQPAFLQRRDQQRKRRFDTG
mgnify:CR=1 FL=1